MQRAHSCNLYGIVFFIVAGPNDWMGPNGKLVAKSESLTFKIDSSVVLEALKMFPDCELVLPVQPSLPVVTYR